MIKLTLETDNRTYTIDWNNDPEINELIDAFCSLLKVQTYLDYTIYYALKGKVDEMEEEFKTLDSIIRSIKNDSQLLEIKS